MFDLVIFLLCYFFITTVLMGIPREYVCLIVGPPGKKNMEVGVNMCTYSDQKPATMKPLKILLIIAFS